MARRRKRPVDCEAEEDARREQRMKEELALAPLRKAPRAQLEAEGISDEGLREMQRILDQVARAAGRTRH